MSKPDLNQRKELTKSISKLDKEISHTIDMRDSFLAKGKIDKAIQVESITLVELFDRKTKLTEKYFSTFPRK
jgi:hypothetical protein